MSSIGETGASQPKTQSDLMNSHSEDFIPIDKRKWNDIPAYGDVKREDSGVWKISKLVTNLVRHRDLTDRETVGAVHWKSMCPKLWRAFQSDSAQTFSDSRWLDVLLYLRAHSGAHTGGELITPELMDHVASPLRWKEFLYQRECSFNVTSILQARHIAGWKDRKEGRQTVFFTPLDPFGDEAEEEFNNDSSRPIKVHFYSKWKPQQDAVYWIHLVRAQEKGLQCWQTRSRAIILCDSVPADCIEKVVSLEGDRTLYQRVSACGGESI